MFKPIQPPPRTLMGPGPSDVHPAVSRAQCAPTVGHLDPVFLQIMDEVRVMMRAVYGTENPLTMPMSGTGSAGMETLFVNLLEPGDKALIGVNGVFGTRMAEVARRCGAEVTVVDAPWGRALDPEDLRKAAKAGGFKVMALVHAETSTGVRQELTPMRAIADEAGALLLTDCVTSFAGQPIDLDAHGVDAAYSGTQKCLSAPPGLAPISFSPKAVEVLSSRQRPVQSWYLDLNLIARYWGGERAYHHTAPVNQIYALHEALRLTLEEGLEARFARHAANGAALRAGLTAMGLELPVPAAERLDQLTLVQIPEGVSDKAIRGRLLNDYDLEIGGGLGKFAGKAWRIGLMGHACSRRNVLLALGALRSALASEGFEAAGDPITAAQAV